MNHLERADVGKMVSARCVTETAFHRVADQAAFGTRPGGIHPQPRSALPQKLEQVALGNSRLNRYAGQFFVEQCDPIHPTQVNQSTAADDRDIRAIAPVFSRC